MKIIVSGDVKEIGNRNKKKESGVKQEMDELLTSISVDPRDIIDAAIAYSQAKVHKTKKRLSKQNKGMYFYYN